MSYLQTDLRFLSEIAGYLPKFKWIKAGRIARCRCIICGDSQKDKTKTRGFFFVYDGEDGEALVYKCHNCGVSLSFGHFLKEEFPDIYRDYRLEHFRGGKVEKLSSFKPKTEPVQTPRITPVQTPVITSNKYDWQYVSDLGPNHPAKIYCIGRGMTPVQMSKIVFTYNFRDWTEKYIGKVDVLPPKDSRLIFPFIDANGTCYGAQGRAYTEVASHERFRSAMKEGAKEGKVFGLERIDPTKPVIVVEGVIDSLFLPNCIAICGGDISDRFLSLSDTVFVALDNEPRHPDTVNRMEKAISLGYRVVFWEIDTKYKDINDMVLKAKMPTKDILRHIVEKSLSGSRAQLKFKFWKKI